MAAVSKRVEKVVRKAIAAILEEPKAFDMRYWHSGEYNETGDWCATSHCFAGYVVVQAGCKPAVDTASDVEVPQKLRDKYQLMFREPTPVVARKILGIHSEAESDSLFLSSIWPAQFFARYRRASRPATKAKIAADRFEYFVETGK